VDREWFITTAAERQDYVKLLGIALEDSDWRLLSYAVMSNHIHLASVAGEQPLDAWIRPVHSRFADNMNRAYDRIGAMFVRGPKAYPAAPGSLRELVAYIHNNPVRANVCTAATGSTWTSHRAYVGAAPVPRWLHVSEGMERAGFDDPRAFDAWVDDPTRIEAEPKFTEEYYEREIEIARERVLLSRASAFQRTAEAIVAATAQTVGITLDHLRSSKRGDAEVLARSIAVHCASVVGVSGQAIAKALHVSQQRASVLRRQRTCEEEESFCTEVLRRIETSRSSGA
jgi:hypothetical protein